MRGDLLLLSPCTSITCWLFVGKILNRYISVNTKYVTHPKTHTGLTPASHFCSINMPLRKVAVPPLSGKNRKNATCCLGPRVETELLRATQQNMFLIVSFFYLYFIIEEGLASEKFCVFSQKRDGEKNLMYIPPKHEIIYLSARNTSYVFSVAGMYYTGEQRQYSLL